MIAYLVTNTVNGKQYVGATKKRMAARWWLHLWEAENKPGEKLLQQDIQTYGPGAFTVEVIASAASMSDLYYLEKTLIAQHRTFFADGGYNMTRGGIGALGHVPSATSRAKLRTSLKGRAKSDTHRANLRANHKGMTGKIPSRAHRAKIGAVFSERVWITDGTLTKRIAKDACIPNGWSLGRGKNHKAPISDLARRKAAQ
jgi:group I intron endonuclease